MRVTASRKAHIGGLIANVKRGIGGSVNFFELEARLRDRLHIKLEMQAMIGKDNPCLGAIYHAGLNQ